MVVKPTGLHILRLLGAIVTLILLFNCERDKHKPGTISEIQFLDNWYLGPCFAGALLLIHDTALVIQDYNSYVEFGNSVKDTNIYNVDCSNATLPCVDFDNYFLVARPTWGGGCSVEYFRDIEIDNTSGTLLYKIEVCYYGLCAMGIANFNWALIPKKYSEYNLQYNVKETYVLD